MPRKFWTVGAHSFVSTFNNRLDAGTKRKHSIFYNCLKHLISIRVFLCGPQFFHALSFALSQTSDPSNSSVASPLQVAQEWVLAEHRPSAPSVASGGTQQLRSLSLFSREKWKNGEGKREEILSQKSLSKGFHASDVQQLKVPSKSLVHGEVTVSTCRSFYIIWPVLNWELKAKSIRVSTSHKLWILGPSLLTIHPFFLGFSYVFMGSCCFPCRLGFPRTKISWPLSCSRTRSAASALT